MGAGKGKTKRAHTNGQTADVQKSPDTPPTADKLAPQASVTTKTANTIPSVYLPYRSYYDTNYLIWTALNEHRRQGLAIISEGDVVVELRDRFNLMADPNDMGVIIRPEAIPLTSDDQERIKRALTFCLDEEYDDLTNEQKKPAQQIIEAINNRYNTLLRTKIGTPEKITF